MVFLFKFEERLAESAHRPITIVAKAINWTQATKKPTASAQWAPQEWKRPYL